MIFQAGDFNTARFYLENQRAIRGCTRRQETTGAAGKPIEVASDAHKRLLGELDQMGARLRATSEYRARRANGEDHEPAAIRRRTPDQVEFIRVWLALRETIREAIMTASRPGWNVLAAFERTFEAADGRKLH
jgi:hypothetical protein